VINFAAVVADLKIEIMISNVNNPSAARENVKIGVLTYNFNGSDGSRTYLNYELFNIFLNSKTTVANS
jgi:nitrogenase molybdenum-iron protein alpha/beta subunit